MREHITNRPLHHQHCYWTSPITMHQHHKMIFTNVVSFIIILDAYSGGLPILYFHAVEIDNYWVGYDTLIYGVEVVSLVAFLLQYAKIIHLNPAVPFFFVRLELLHHFIVYLIGHLLKKSIPQHLHNRQQIPSFLQFPQIGCPVQLKGHRCLRYKLHTKFLKICPMLFNRFIHEYSVLVLAANTVQLRECR